MARGSLYVRYHVYRSRNDDAVAMSRRWMRDADRVIEFHAMLRPFFLATTWPGLKTNGSNNQFLRRQQR